MSADWLHDLGIRVSDLIAGMAGGVVNAFVFRRSEPWAIVGSVVVGALTANYLGEPATRITGGMVSGGAAAFLVGLGGMALCQGLVEAIKRWRPNIPGGQPGGLS